MMAEWTLQRGRKIIPQAIPVIEKPVEQESEECSQVDFDCRITKLEEKMKDE
jgi:hypothetical protein